MPISQIDIKGIKASYQDKKIIFDFITDPQTRILNEVKQIFLKENQINFLKEEVTFVQIEEQIKRNKELIFLLQSRYLAYLDLKQE